MKTLKRVEEQEMTSLHFKLLFFHFVLLLFISSGLESDIFDESVDIKLSDHESSSNNINTYKSSQNSTYEDDSNTLKNSWNREGKRNPNSNKTAASKSQNSNENDGWEANQRISEQEARRKRREQERIQHDRYTAKKTLQAAADENCDWKIQPFSILRGELCGSYYKVLGLDRKRGIIDKSDVKRAYRQKSLHVHPDKNSSPEAIAAFEVVQEAYECLSEETCRKSYDGQLLEAEERISQFRYLMKQKIREKAIQVISNAHYYLSISAHHVYQTGMDLWELSGELQVQIFGQKRPVGKVVFALVLLWKASFLLKLHAISYAIVRINYELAKAHGLL